jgi:hypothetical protein
VKIDRLLCSTIRQGFYELRNFNDAIVWQLLDSVDEFLLPHNRKHCERCDTATRTRHTCRYVSARRRNSKSAANASNCSLGNLSMTRHGGGFLVCRFDILRVRAANPCAKEDSIAFTSELDRFASCCAKGDFFTTDSFSGKSVMTRRGRKPVREAVLRVFGFELPPRVKTNTPAMPYRFTKR